MLLASVYGYAQKAKLEFNLQKDSTYYLTADVNMGIDQFIQGTHQIMKTTIVGVSSNKVLSVQDSVYNIAVTYKSLAMNMTMGDRVISFDSEDADTTNMFSKVMRNMTGKSFNMKLSKRGQIVEVSNTDNLFTDIFKDFPPINEQKKAQALAQAKQSFNDKSIKGNFQESFVIYPTVPVQTGDTWTNQTPMETAAISIKTNTVFTLNSITANTYEISGHASIVPDKVPAFKKTSSYFMRLRHVTGNTTAKLSIDKKTGWIVKSEITKQVKGDVELKNTLEGPVMLTYPMVVNANLKATGHQ
jgi:hypothetical protein